MLHAYGIALCLTRNLADEIDGSRGDGKWRRVHLAEVSLLNGLRHNVGENKFTNSKQYRDKARR